MSFAGGGVAVGVAITGSTVGSRVGVAVGGRGVGLGVAVAVGLGVEVAVAVGVAVGVAMGVFVGVGVSRSSGTMVAHGGIVARGRRLGWSTRSLQDARAAHRSITNTNLGRTSEVYISPLTDVLGPVGPGALLEGEPAASLVCATSLPTQWPRPKWLQRRPGPPLSISGQLMVGDEGFEPPTPSV